MEQVLFGGNTDLINPDPGIFPESHSIVGGFAWSQPHQAYIRRIVSTSGYIKKLRVELDGAPGAGKKYVFTLSVNGAPTALEVEIADAATSGSDMVHWVRVVGGDEVVLSVDPDGVPTARYAFWSSVFDGDIPNESLILGGGLGDVSKTDITYTQIMSSFPAWNPIDENDHRQIVPTAGVLKNLYIGLEFDPGTAPDAYRFTVRLNGATVAQSLIVTITANDTKGNDLVHELAVVAGDVLTFKCEPLNTPLEEPYVFWGMTFVATIDGESIILGGCGNTLDRLVTEYHKISERTYANWIPDETDEKLRGQVCTLKKFYLMLSSAPGVGNSYDFWIRIAGANSNVTVNIQDNDTTGNSGGLEDNVGLDEDVNLKVVPTDNPIAVKSFWGFVSYIEPQSGWGGKLFGVSSPNRVAKIFGIPIADITKVMGVG